MPYVPECILKWDKTQIFLEEHVSRLSLFGNYQILKFHDLTQDTFSHV